MQQPPGRKSTTEAFPGMSWWEKEANTASSFTALAECPTNAASTHHFITRLLAFSGSVKASVRAMVFYKNPCFLPPPFFNAYFQLWQ